MFAIFALCLLGLHGAASVSHTLQYFYTGTTGLKEFPAFVAVGIVDGEQIDYYDSISEKNVLKQTWMEGVRDESGITNVRRGIQQNFGGSIGILMDRFNETGGIHLWQRMVGCEWDDETGEINGFNQYGYDGEDFVALDLKTETWIAPTPQAVITKHKWDNDKANTAYLKNYFTQICPDWLKKYVNYGRSSLMRTDLPSVSLLQKTPSSPISCHATGFYPNRAEMFWRKDGEEIHEGVDKGEILPNHDGTFQMSVEMDFSAVPDEEQKKYECVFQLAGVNEDVITKMGQTRRNVPGSRFPGGPVVGGVIGGLVVVLVLVVVGVVLWKKPKKGFTRASTSDSSSSSSDGGEKKGPV